MFEYLYSEIIDNTEFCYFYASNNSVYHIALFLQEGKISRDQIQSSSMGEKLVVKLCNIFEYEFTRKQKYYHLHLSFSPNPAMNKFEPHIYQSYAKGRYVPSWMRPNFEDFYKINKKTWQDLFSRDTPPCLLLSENVEYEFDDTDEEYLLELERQEYEKADKRSAEDLLSNSSESNTVVDEDVYLDDSDLDIEN